MDKTTENARMREAVTVLFWLMLLVFFIYTFQSITEFQTLTNPGRQRAFVRVLTALSRPNLLDSEVVREVVQKILETVQIAFVATTISAVFAIPITFLSARPSSSWGRGFSVFLQLILSAIRAVHPLIVTIPTLLLTGIGPTTGVLALTIFSSAVLIGRFSEYAQQHGSLSWGMLAKAYFPGLAFRQLPVNTLIATVLGFMGGGGIGYWLILHLNLLDYSNASVAILACVIVIGSIDLFSIAVWRRIESRTSA